jgi:hypothetical protein
MRESFCPVICAACTEVVFSECMELKQGNWEIFGEGVQARICRLPETGAQPVTFMQSTADSPEEGG